MGVVNMGIKVKDDQYKYFILREIFASIFFTLGLFSILSLFLYSSGSGIDLKGSVGSVGLYISDKLGIYFGLSSFMFPVVMIYTSFIDYVRLAEYYLKPWIFVKITG